MKTEPPICCGAPMVKRPEPRYCPTCNREEALLTEPVDDDEYDEMNRLFDAGLAMANEVVGQLTAGGHRFSATAPGVCSLLSAVAKMIIESKKRP